MKKNLYLVALLSLAVSLHACKKAIEVTDPENEITGTKAAPDGFAYTTTQDLELNIRLLNDSEKPLQGVMVSIYDPANVNSGSEIISAISDKNGYVKSKFKSSSALTNFVVDAKYFGLLRNVTVFAQNHTVTAVIGGAAIASGNIVPEKLSYNSAANYKLAAGEVTTNAISSKTVLDYKPELYDELGRPLASRLSATDVIDWDKLKQSIDAALPESKHVQAKYIHTEAPANLKITALADVWITFVHEGADFRNSFGYYTYPTGNPPTTDAEIDSIHMVFPNASLKGARGAGNMIRGDKIKIGRFKAGVSIGFVLFQNAYNNNKTITTSNLTFYSNELLNPEEAKYKRHNVILNNASQGTYLIGFEDINRTPFIVNKSDNDFNDLVVYAQSNPVTAISPVDIPYLEESVKDTDGDGVPDSRDEYPDDKDRAYNRYYPSESIWGTTTFEDQWPAEADYDLNDLVISYQYKFAMSSANQVADLTAQYKTLAAGALQPNGFGVQLPILASAISSVTGANRSENYVKVSSNGTEAGQTKAVVVAFENHRALFGGFQSYINTLTSHNLYSYPTVSLKINFTTPLDESFTATAPFNPFMISNMDRGREIHLVNAEPTALANTSLFGTSSDDSKPSNGRYYLTKTNRPFAMDFYGPFIYPQERVDINTAYPHFAAWALSGGKEFLDWYTNPGKGYRDESSLYIRK